MMSGKTVSSTFGLFAFSVALVACSGRDRVTNVSGALAVFPGNVDFSLVALHDTRDMDVKLRNVGRSGLEIRGARVDDKGGIYTVQSADGGITDIIPGEEVHLVVRFAPLDAGVVATTLKVQSDSPGTKELTVALEGTGVDAHATLGARLMDFGRIEAQATTSKLLKLSNTSPLPVVVSAKGIGDDGNDFTMPPLTLAPGEEKNAAVVFAPQLVGKKVAGLAVTPCTGCDPVIVNLVGEALEQAVVADPLVVDFGQVPVDFTTTHAAVLHNLSTEVQTVTGQHLSAGSDESFNTPTKAFVATLQPDEWRPFDNTFSPGHLNVSSGGVDYDVKSVRHPNTHAGLTGKGGLAQLCISPSDYDFKKQPIGSKTTLTLNIQNCGQVTGKPIVFQNFALEAGSSTDQFTSDFSPPPAPGVTLFAGQSINIKINYEPTRDGASKVLADIVTDGGTSTVQLTGSATLFPPCDLLVTPTSLNFGTLAPEHGGLLTIKVANHGDTTCVLKNVQIGDSGGGAFRLPGGNVDNIIMYPADYFAFDVEYVAPVGGGSVNGTVTMSPASSTVITVPLKGNSVDTCIVANPVFLDFGVASPNCPPHPMSVDLFNNCKKAVSILKAEVGTGSTNGEFAITNTSPATPDTLAPGEHLTVQAAYLARTIGLNAMPLFVSVLGTPEPFLVPLIGELLGKDTITDTFTQQVANKVDVLFVVDNTASMIEEDPRIQSSIPAFVSAAAAKGLDLHVGVTTTGTVAVSDACPGGAQGGEAGRLFPVNNTTPRILTQATPNFAALLQTNTAVGRCGNAENAFEAAQLALSLPLSILADDPSTAQTFDGNLGFLRDDAALEIIFIGDEDDHSPNDVGTYVKALQNVKGKTQLERTRIYVIAPPSTLCAGAAGTGTRYQQAAALTGGDSLSICSSDYAPLFREAAGHDFQPSATFKLSGVPTTGTLTVTVNGTAVAGYTYDPGTSTVTFTSLPPPGAKIAMTYRKVCG